MFGQGASVAENRRWPALVRYIVDKIIAAKPKMPRHTALAPPGLAAAIG